MSIFFLEIVLIHLHSRQVVVVFPTESWGHFWATCVYPFVSLMGFNPQNSSRAVHSHRVSSVGGYGEGSVYSRPIIILLIGCLSGAVFGGIHCLGWNALFHGHAEQILWRAASLAIVSAPVSILLMWGCAIWLNSLDEVSMSFAVSRTLTSLVPLASIFIYIVARVILIVLILMSFQSLPPGIYDTVAWTNFIPHL
jgi:hypothetical protein